MTWLIAPELLLTFEDLEDELSPYDKKRIIRERTYAMKIILHKMHKLRKMLTEKKQLISNSILGGKMSQKFD